MAICARLLDHLPVEVDDCSTTSPGRLGDGSGFHGRGLSLFGGGQDRAGAGTRCWGRLTWWVARRGRAGRRGTPLSSGQ